MSLTGQLLVAMPQMLDERFARSVVYICAHSGEAGAMGLVINKPLGSLTMGELFAQLDISPSGAAGSRPVHYGGPVEAGRGFVLHTADYNEDATLVVDDNIALTATLDVLRAIGQGRGPRRSLFALGYAGWAPGQLDAEISSQWLAFGPGRRRDHFRSQPRPKMAAGARQARRRPDDAVERGGARLIDRATRL